MKLIRKILAASAAAVLLSGIAATQASAVNVDGAHATAVPVSATYPLRPSSVGSSQLTDNGTGEIDLGPALRNKINGGIATANTALTKANQALAAPDANSLGAAYYAVAFYDVGDTNAGAIATVACVKETDVAISGGVQTVGLDATANSRNTPVNSSFPGRMDWSTNAPKPNRLDGWIVQFGGNAGTVSDKAPEKEKIWALCVPGLTTVVTQTYLQSAD